MQTYLIVGLGNPEGKYFNTYHNVGFACCDNLARIFGVEFSKKGNALFATYTRGGNCVILQKPLTYMNRSGEAVVSIVRKRKIAHDHVIVIHDDLYIDKGQIRVATSGSHAGHNGVRNIIEHLASQNFLRVKIGIAPLKQTQGFANYVLDKIDKDSRALVDSAFEKATNACIAITSGEPISKIQNQFNTKNRMVDTNNTVSNRQENTPNCQDNMLNRQEKSMLNSQNKSIVMPSSQSKLNGGAHD